MNIKILTSWKTSDAGGFFPVRVNWHGIQFITDRHCRDYDWLVVYDEMPRDYPRENLACPPDHTILVTQEPPSIKLYSPAYTRQFNYVLTTHDPHILRHRHYRRGTGTLIWLNGRSPEENAACPDFPKSELISAICSNKQGKHTEHFKRFRLIQYLQQNIHELKWYGWGFKPLPQKYQAMDAYRYHLAIENHIHPYHWTEKLADAYLSLCLPFYAGDPQLERILPPESFIRIPIDQPEKALCIIQKAIANNEYEKRLPAIRQARQLIVERYNLWQQILDTIAEHETRNPGSFCIPGACIIERHRLRHNPINLLSELGNKVRVHLTHSS